MNLGRILCAIRGHAYTKWQYRKSLIATTQRSRRCKRCGRQEHEEAPTPKRTRMTAKRELEQIANGG